MDERKKEISRSVPYVGKPIHPPKGASALHARERDIIVLFSTI
jgi:hypothetical protein